MEYPRSGVFERRPAGWATPVTLDLMTSFPAQLVRNSTNGLLPIFKFSALHAVLEEPLAYSV